MDRLSINKFDPMHQLTDCFNMVILGKRHTGKSTLLKDIIYRLNAKGYPRIVVFSGTEEGNEFFSSCVPKPYIHNGLDMDKFKAVIDVQRKIVTSCREAETQLGRPPDVDTRLVIILDDLMFKRNMTRNEVFSLIFLNGRHWKISVILTCQYMMSLDTACRANTDFLFVLRESIPKNRDKIFENWFGIFNSKKQFFHVLDHCTKDYEALVLDNTQPTMAVERCVFWYKGELNLPPFMFGGDKFKKWAEDKKDGEKKKLI